ncbi:methionine--tRNA ligase [Engelhardtia mirabilis]|uniref:Methionine--tRNA ligase n=1 Tax=Engelhardtia mirabilis TaxID=2528011 RepID=A0A518BNR1_9BACT|nr:Methionine--tRNA ligase [Planctomycetes bacterium Pla133]QDV02945.1 Methionine--tRNA ligase [Planctomycetes bacterium Pla86]
MPRYLVTSALPYANGPLHFGHVAGAYLPADVYVRTLRMQGEEVLYVCGADEHGVAITIGADQKGEPYPDYVAHWRDGMKAMFDRLGIAFDRWSGTSVSPRHVEFTQEFFRRLVDGGYFNAREKEQLYSPGEERFLADRYVVGTCPNCGFEEARGDECPNCGSWHDALDLGQPRSKLSGEALERRMSTNWYLDLPKLRDEYLGQWTRDHDWKPNVRAFIEGLLKDVPERAMTRDMSWGVPVPTDVAEGAEGKVLYVWFDAPIGYVSITAEWAAAQGDPDGWKRWWKDPETRLVNFIGKDNIPFHCLIFPAMLYGQQDGWILPWAVPANEFYNLEGRKFSTSGGWSIDLDAFFDRYDAEAARFYLLASGPETADSEWRWEGFQDCVNAQLADTIGNLATRVLRFCGKHFDGAIPPVGDHAAEFDALLLSECGEVADPGASIREFRFRRAAEELVANARIANVFVDRAAPWTLRKTDLPRAAAALATAAEWIALTARWMSPFMPGKAQQLWAMVGGAGAVEDASWPAAPVAGAWRSFPSGQALGEVDGLFAKLEDDQIAAEIEALRQRS